MKMMKSALILHAWLDTPDKHWYPWLKKELETRGYTVYLPEIPTMNTQTPDLAAQMEFIEKNVPLDEDFIVFGHSLGALLAMRLAEKHTFSKLFLVAGWDFDDLTVEHQSYWQTKMDHAAIKKNVKEIIITSSDNDPYITKIQSNDMSKRLGGKFILIKNAGHFTEEYRITKIPELLTYLE